MHEYVATQGRERSQLRNYVSLLRFPYHSSFVGVLLYGGIYALNAITDAEKDSRHPLKQFRPVASGEISRRAAAVFAAGLIFFGFISGWVWLGDESMHVYLLLLIINLAYSY